MDQISYQGLEQLEENFAYLVEDVVYVPEPMENPFYMVKLMYMVGWYFIVHLPTSFGTAYHEAAANQNGRIYFVKIAQDFQPCAGDLPNCVHL